MADGAYIGTGARRAAGADGFGPGSGLTRPGKPASDIGRDAAAFVSMPGQPA